MKESLSRESLETTTVTQAHKRKTPEFSVSIRNLDSRGPFKTERRSSSHLAHGLNSTPGLEYPRVLALSEEHWDGGYDDEVSSHKEDVLLPVVVVTGVGGIALIILGLPVWGGVIVTIAGATAVVGAVHRIKKHRKI